MVDFYRSRPIIVHVDVDQQYCQHCITGHVAGNGRANVTDYLGGIKLPDRDLYVLAAVW